jgi:opacity protein-like surface antigen
MAYTLVRVYRALVTNGYWIARASLYPLLLLAPEPAYAISKEFHALLGGIAHEISGRYQRVDDPTCRKEAWTQAIAVLVQASKVPDGVGPSPWTEDNETADLRMRRRAEGGGEQPGGECQMDLDAVWRKDRSGKTGGVITGQVVMRCQCKRGTPDELKEAIVRFKVPVVLVQGPSAHLFQPKPDAEYSVFATCCSNEKHRTVWLPLLSGQPTYLYLWFTPTVEPSKDAPTLTGEKARLQSELGQTNSEIEKTEGEITKNVELIEYVKINVRDAEMGVKALGNVNKGEFTLSNGERMKATSVSGGGIKVERINPDGSTTIVRERTTRKALIDDAATLEAKQKELKVLKETRDKLDAQWETLLDKKARLESDLDQAQAPSAEEKQVPQAGATQSSSCLTLDPTTGLLSPVGNVNSPNCLRTDPTSGVLTPVGSTAASRCLELDPTTGLLSPVGNVSSPNCLRTDPTSGVLTLVGSTTAPSLGLAQGATSPSQAQAPVAGAYTPWEKEEWGVSLGVGYAEFETPQVDSGTLVTGTPGSEKKGVETEAYLSDVFFGLALTGKMGKLEFTYFDGDGSERASEPVGGLPVAFVYYEPAASGSLGLNTRSNGGVFRGKNEVTTYYFRYQLPFNFHESSTNSYYSEVGPTLFGGNTDYCYWARTQSINLSGIFSETHQSVDEQHYGLGIRGTHLHRLTDYIIGRFVLDIDGYYRDSDLHSRQDNVCSAPGCPPANTFTARNDDSDSGFSWGVGVKAGLDYAFTENWALGMEFNYRYRHDTAALKNPTSTIDFDRPPHLDTTGVNAWGIGIRLSYTFD